MRQVLCLGIIGLIVLSLLGLPRFQAQANEPAPNSDAFAAATAGAAFPADVRELISQNCYACHNAEDKKGDIDFTAFRTAEDLKKNTEIWEWAADAVSEGFMPPRRHAKLSPEAKKRLTTYFQQLSKGQAPNDGIGTVPIRRLTQGEYERTIRMLTGKPLSVAQRLPVDEVGEEGFGNAAAMQTLTGGHMDRYMRTAKYVASHARFLPVDGIVFETAPPVAAATAQHTDYINRIWKVYRQHLAFKRNPSVELGPTLHVLWQHSRSPKTDLDQICKAENVHTGHARWLAEQLKKPTDSPWVNQLIVEPWQAILADQSLDEAEAKKRLLALGKGVELILADSMDFNDVALALGGIGNGNGFAKHIYPDRFPRFASSIIERNGEHFLPLHIVLTDAGIGEAGVAEMKMDTRVAAAFASKYADDGAVKRQKPDVLRLSYPGAYAAEVKISEKQAKAFAAAAKTRGRVRDKQLIGLLKMERQILTGAGAQFFVCSQPILDGHGQPITKSPAAGQVLPGQPQMAYRTGNFVGESPLGLPAPREASEKFSKTMVGFDEMLDRFVPAGYPALINRRQWVYFRGWAPRWGDGPEVRYTRYEPFYQWFTTVIADEATAKQLDGYWLDFRAATEEAKFRFDGLTDRYREQIAGLPFEQRGAALRNVTVGILKQHAKMPRSPAERWDEAIAMRDQIVERQEAIAPREVRRFASQAWRRSITDDELAALMDIYKSLRADGEDPQESMRTVIAAVLISPHFLMRVEPASKDGKPGPIGADALAVRLSYFLTSGPPDAELVAAAKDGSLLKDEVLIAQAERLLREPDTFITEFFGQWLLFKHYYSLLQIDMDRFPEFTPQMRELLHEQMIRQFDHLVRQNRPMTDLTTGTEIFMSPHLAWYYGLDVDAIDWPKDRKGKPLQLPKKDEDYFRRHRKTGKLTDEPRFTELYLVDLSKTDRRGLWGMGAMLAMSSKPLRTDPIMRAKWVYTRLLGKRLAEPPPNAGQLPEDDKQGDGLTVRQRLVAHRTRADCMSCHARFDHFGFALERYDAIGRWREKGAEGLAIDDSFGREVGGGTYAGPTGLAEYFDDNEHLFFETFCRKLIAYSLGRDPLPSDEPLIKRMMAHGKANGHRFFAYVEPLLLSKQFRYHTGSKSAGPAAKESRHD